MLRTRLFVRICGPSTLALAGLMPCRAASTTPGSERQSTFKWTGLGQRVEKTAGHACVNIGEEQLMFFPEKGGWLGGQRVFTMDAADNFRQYPIKINGKFKNPKDAWVTMVPPRSVYIVQPKAQLRKQAFGVIDTGTVDYVPITTNGPKGKPQTILPALTEVATAAIGRTVYIVGETYLNTIRPSGTPSVYAYYAIEGSDAKLLELPDVGPGPKSRKDLKVIAAKGKLFVFSRPTIGMQMVVHFYDPVREMWVEPTLRGKTPLALQYASANLMTIDGREKVVFFGGMSGSDNPISRQVSGDLHVLDLDAMEWEKPPEIVGVGPSPRYSHTATNLSDNKLIVIGGKTDWRKFGDMYLLQAIGAKDKDRVRQQS